MNAPTKIDPTRCVNVVEVASGPNDWKYGLHPEHVRHGWKWRTDAMKRVGELGCKRHILHLPLGRQIDKGFTFEMVSVLLADGAQYRKLAETFASAMAPLTRDGHRIDVYLGFLQSEAMTALHVQGKRDDYLRALATNLKPFLDAGCGTMYFDVSALIKKGSVEHAVLSLLDAFGVKPGMEAWPGGTGEAWEHLTGYPVYIVEGDYQAQTKRPSAAPKARMGQVVRTLNQYLWKGDAGESLLSAYRQILADGDTPGLDLGNTPSEIVNG